MSVELQITLSALFSIASLMSALVFSFAGSESFQKGMSNQSTVYSSISIMFIFISIIFALALFISILGIEGV